MKTVTFEDSAILFIDSHNGQYIPQSFANNIILDQWEGINFEDLQTCKDGPGNEWYWEAWCNIMDNATLIHPDNNQRYYIYQNEDVWLVPEGVESPEW